MPNGKILSEVPDIAKKYEISYNVLYGFIGKGAASTIKQESMSISVSFQNQQP